MRCRASIQCFRREGGGGEMLFVAVFAACGAGQAGGDHGHGDGEDAVGDEANTDTPVLRHGGHEERENKGADAAAGGGEADGDL